MEVLKNYILIISIHFIASYTMIVMTKTVMTH